MMIRRCMIATIRGQLWPRFADSAALMAGFSGPPRERRVRRTEDRFCPIDGRGLLPLAASEGQTSIIRLTGSLSGSAALSAPPGATALGGIPLADVVNRYAVLVNHMGFIVCSLFPE